MSILEILGIKRTASSSASGSSSSPGDSDTVRKIARQLEVMDPDKARYVAAFAYVLGRIANADSHISEEETREMERLVETHGQLSEEQAVLVVEIAKSQNRLFGGTENFVVTREFRAIATRQQREQLLHCLFAVSAADDSISATEEAQGRQVASELGFTHREFIAIRARYSDKRELLKKSREQAK